MPTSKEYLSKMLLNKNIQAAIATIRHTEGTSAPDGYLYLYGSSPKNKLRFADTSTHPNNLQVHNNISSTAAGIGQWLYRTWKVLSETYDIKGFDLQSQMMLFVAHFDSIGVLNDLSKGYMLRDDVMTKLSTQWASLPYSRYGQPTHSIADVRDYFIGAGGAIG